MKAEFFLHLYSIELPLGRRDTMHCPECGSAIVAGSAFCPACGRPLLESSQDTRREGKSLVGFSPKIDDPAFARYQKASSSWAMIFAGALALIAIVGFPIYGRVSGELEMPTSLYYGMGIGGMFIAIALVQITARGRDTTWDGVVVGKQVFERETYDKTNDMHSTHTIYECKVKRSNGKVYTHQHEDYDTVFSYFDIGDKVRHHKGFDGYEKYDKSKDTIIFCIACGAIHDISDDICSRCKCPLLK